jgi:recombination protein RecA
MKREKRRQVRVKRSIEVSQKGLIRFSKVVSTGSTLLDLIISGKRIPGGGLPSGILVEVYGTPGSGKTAILAEICASAQSKGGEVRFRDPESRLDKEYAEVYGVNIKDDYFDYDRPETVKQLFKDHRTWKPNEETLNVFAGDSVAAVSTDMEMEDEDKRGQRQAKEFSQNLRKSARSLSRENIITVFTNQLREGERGETTPGGKAIPFYASLRIRVSQNEMITKKKKLKNKVEAKKTIGIVSTCYVKKSTVDDPYRMCDIYILFGYGIDDTRSNLQYMKDMTKDTMYDCFGKRFHGVDTAIDYIEKNKFQNKLKKLVIQTWEQIENEFAIKREPKER